MRTPYGSPSKVAEKSRREPSGRGTPAMSSPGASPVVGKRDSSEACCSGAQLCWNVDVEDWANAGFFAMTIDYRLVGASPAPAPYQDVLSAIRFVRANSERYGVDPDRIQYVELHGTGTRRGDPVDSDAGSRRRGDPGVTGARPIRAAGRRAPS